ncbi:hypothetical protein [Chthoniobacter flavus]|uniref:hypothetical protein n=1 Tax=Chthoniobacter flavus TaxID=191863 RepID=UPI0012FA5F9A|nr:hypothetical protein [Chthoniobacter flavus]
MRKDSDYLQFRPYHAFTAHATRPEQLTGGIRWWHAAMIFGAAALLLAVGAWLCFR